MSEAESGAAEGGIGARAGRIPAALVERARNSARLGRGDQSQLSIWFWELDRVLLALILVLIAIGLIAVAAASPVAAAKHSTEAHQFDPLYYFHRQIGWVAVGVPLMLIVSMLPKDQARRMAIVMMGIFLFLLFLVPLIGNEVNGARRWIGYGPATLQPSEFLKPAFAVTTAWILSWRVRDPSLPVMALSFCLVLLIGTLMMMQPNLGGTIIFFGIWFVLVLLAGLSAQIIGLSILGGISGLICAYFLYPVAFQRINAWLAGPGQYDQVSFAQQTLTGGGLTGVGPGAGVFKNNLPEAHTDYIFSVIGEEFGLIACAIIATIYFAIAARVMLRLLEEKDLFTILAVTGLTSQLVGQATINMAVNLQLFPSKGMTLPFISYGGSSMLALSISAGLLLAFTRRNPYLDRSPFDPYRKQDRRRT